MFPQTPAFDYISPQNSNSMMNYMDQSRRSPSCHCSPPPGVEKGKSRKSSPRLNKFDTLGTSHHLLFVISTEVRFRGGQIPSIFQQASHFSRLSPASLKKYESTFLRFLRILMKCLKLKDPPLHLRVKKFIRYCAEKEKKMINSDGDCIAICSNLYSLVGHENWRMAQKMLDLSIISKDIKKSSREREKR